MDFSLGYQSFRVDLHFRKAEFSPYSIEKSRGAIPLKAAQSSKDLCFRSSASRNVEKPIHSMNSFQEFSALDRVNEDANFNGQSDCVPSSVMGSIEIYRFFHPPRCPGAPPLERGAGPRLLASRVEVGCQILLSLPGPMSSGEGLR